YAACLYIDNGETQVVMVTLDLLFFSKKHVTAVRQRVEAACGIPGGNIMISTSHTHSGPWASGRLDIESLEAGKQQNPAYIAFLNDQIVQTILTAKENSFEAEIATGVTVCGAESGVGGNRRFIGGPYDPLVSVITVRDKAGDVRGVFANYTLHPTFIHEWSTVVTADYPSYMRLQISELAPKAVFGFAQGASGNQSSRYYRKSEDYDEAERVGRLLGKAAYQVVENAEWMNFIDIRVASRDMELELRDFGSEEELKQRLADATANYKALFEKYGDSPNRDEYYLWQNANLLVLGLEDQLGYVIMRTKGIRIELCDDEAPVEIQVIRLGDTCIVGVPGEIFVEYALYVKAMAGYSIVVFNELANGCLPGYLYTPEALKFGGYETDTSMLGPKFGRHMVDQVLNTIEEVR
ncbi:MAG: hypothetical protein ABFC73_02605, partial [Clostridiaceae bacterium]